MQVDSRPCQNAVTHFIPQEMAYSQTPSPKYVCTDGSGGKFSADKRLRRCGWAWVVLKSKSGVESFKASDIVVGSQAYSALEGNKQTVNRAELSAVLSACENVAGPMVLYSDSAYVCRIFALPCENWTEYSNSDL